MLWVITVSNTAMWNEIIFAIAGVVIGLVVGWLLAAGRAKSRIAGQAGALEATINELRSQLQQAQADLEQLRSQLDSERQQRVRAQTQLDDANIRLAEERKILEEARQKLSDTFNSLARDALTVNNDAFLKLARENFEKVLIDAKGDLGKRQEAIDGLVKPLAESLQKFDEHVRNLEKTRQQAYTSMEGYIKTLTGTQEQLQKETASLVTALRTPHVRGRWGELTLKRVVELAGMSDHCDFTEQVSVTTDAGRQRPDLIVHLPGEREIVVDAKVALDAFLDAAAADSQEKRQAALKRHADQIRTHMAGLADKSYWQQFAKSPEFVVMFIPGESFFAAAADIDRTLIEDALDRRVVLATPATLIALIRAVAYGWRQEQVAKNAQEISDLGKQLYERMKTMVEHVSQIGDGLQKANKAYNNAVGSIEARVLPAARRFKDLGATAGEDIPALPPVETNPRDITSPEA